MDANDEKTYITIAQLGAIAAGIGLTLADFLARLIETTGG